MGALKTAGCVVLVPISIVLALTGVVQIIRGHDDPSRAGTGRLHSAFLQPQPCRRDDSEICGYERAVKLDLPNGKTETVNQDPLYELVRREGPVTVQVEWIKDLGSATRVLYKDHWYRAAYPGDASIVESIFDLILGLGLLVFSAGALASRFLPDPEPEAAGAGGSGGA